MSKNGAVCLVHYPAIAPCVGSATRLADDSVQATDPVVEGRTALQAGTSRGAAEKTETPSEDGLEAQRGDNGPNAVQQQPRRLEYAITRWGRMGVEVSEAEAVAVAVRGAGEWR